MNNLPIQNLKISRFRGLRNLELKDCGRVNLLVGPNNSGKTSVLDALSLFCRPLDISNWREVAWRREVKSARTPLTEPFKWLFPQFLESGLPNPHNISIEGKGAFAGRKLSADYSEFESFGESEEQDASNLMVQEGGKAEKGLELKVKAHYAEELMGRFDEQTHQLKELDFRVIDNQRFAYSTKVDQPAMLVGFISPVSHRTSQDTTAYLSEALKKESNNDDIRAAVTEVMREIDPGVQRFEIIESGRTAIFIKHRDTGMTPLSAYGDGMRRALLLATTIPAVSNGALLIDEIETALHVNVLDSVLKVLRWAADQYNVQIFATTHSLEAVDGVLNGYEGKLEQLVGYRLSQEEGESRVTRHAGELLRRLRYERGLEIR